jgi:putative ABC transport system permease protein
MIPPVPPDSKTILIHPRLIVREAAALGTQALLFLLCVVLAIVSLVAEQGLSDSIDRALRQDARSLSAADIVIHAHQPISLPMQDRVAQLRRQGRAEAAAAYLFYSMVRPASRQESLLAQIKAVEPGYPFYGNLELASGRPFDQQLQPGSVLVEKSLLDRLHLQIGDSLRLGLATLVVRDVVIREPDRPMDFFSLGPRIFVTAADLPALDLIEPGSRVEYSLLLKVNREDDLQNIAAQLSTLANPESERVATYRSAQSRLKRFYDNFIFFLSLIAIFTLLLAGIAMERAVTALLRGRTWTIAILRTVGARSRFVFTNYLLLVLAVGICGALAGLALGFGLEHLLLRLAGNILPRQTSLYLTWPAALRALATGLVVVTVFCLLPLLRLREVKPAAVFAGQPPTTGGALAQAISLTAILSFFSVLVLRTVEELHTGLYFIGGALALILTCYLLAKALLLVLQRLRNRALLLRQAVRGLFRPGGSTPAIFTTLSASCVLVFTIVLVEHNLSALFIDSFPADAPNLYFIDVQPSQLEDFQKALDRQAEYYPVVRGRVEKVNGVAIDRQLERSKRRDNLGREFSLTWRETLLNDETISQGRGLFRPDLAEPQVSVLDYMAESSGIRIGDTISFNIQGMPLTATVSSIRSRLDRPARPFFVFVFQKNLLSQAPQTYFTGLRVAPDRVADLQDRMVAGFPNISVIDIGATVSIIGGVLQRLLVIIRLLALFGILAGILLIASSITATRAERVQEAVFFKILGATSGFIRRMFFLENLLLGGGSGLIALLLAQTISWLICRQELNISYQPFAGLSLAMFGGVLLLTTFCGWLASIQILRQKPAAYLQRDIE